jgi:hypothetical protein
MVYMQHWCGVEGQLRVIRSTKVFNEYEHVSVFKYYIG